MKIPDSVLSKITDNIDPISIYGEYLNLKRKGNRYWALCPFHQEKTPSFTISPERGVFYCFGCHRGGSIFNFIMEMENVNFIEAVKILAKKAGVVLDDFKENTAENKQREAILELNKRIAGSFNYLLMHGKNARHIRTYIESRKIERETIEQFKLGYAPRDRNWLYDFLSSKHYSKEIMLKSGLFFERGEKLIALFYDRLIFPIFNYRGDIIGFGGRTLQTNNTPKYINSPDSFIFHKKDNVYGMYQAIKEIKTKREIFIVEGYMDVLAVYQAGIRNVVAPLGTAFTEEQARVLKRYADKVILAFDGDEAGRNANIRSLGILESYDFENRVVPFKENSDPAEIYEKEGAMSLKKHLDYSINGFQYLLNYEISRNDFETPEGRRKIAESLYPFIEKVKSEVKRELYIETIAEKIGVDSKAVYNDFISRSYGTTPKSTNSYVNEAKDIRVDKELFLMLATLINRNYFEYVRKMIEENDIVGSHAKEIYIALEESFRENEESLDAVLDRIENRQLKDLIYRKVASGEFNVNVEQIIKDGIAELKRQSLERKRTEIIRKMNRIKRVKDYEKEMKDLLEEKIFLDEELKKLRVR